MSYGLVSYFGLKQYRANLLAREAAAAEAINNNNSNNSNNSNSNNTMLVSRSWMYGRTRESDSQNRGEELQSLLGDSRDKDGGSGGSLGTGGPGLGSLGGRDGRDGRGKEEARIYQTAVEYSVDTHEYQPLPRAPAAHSTNH